MKNQKKAIILAAGIGSRLAPITDIKPKSLVRVGGKSIIDYQIDGYLKAGLKEGDIIIVGGYFLDKIKEHLNVKYPNIKVIENSKYKTTNNMYSLYLALKYIKKNKFAFDALFINNADCVYDERLMSKFINCHHSNAIASKVGVYIEESMKIELSDGGNISNISKNISPAESAGVSVDLYKYDSHAVKLLTRIINEFIEIKKDLNQWTEVSFPVLFKNIDVFPFDVKNSNWVEVDNEDDLLIADNIFSGFNHREKKAFICDVDGTLCVGKTPIESAINFIKNNSDKLDFYYLTNNTSRIPSDYTKKLSKFGVSVNENQITTPLFSLVDYIKTRGYSSVYLIANKKVKAFIINELPSVSVDYDLANNQALILTYDTEITYDKLKNASILLNKKEIDYIATHSDLFCPSEDGPIPDIGSIIALIKETNGFYPQVILGKPSMSLIKSQIKKYGKNNLAIVGDRLYTDKKLADNAEIDFVCVLSGETDRIDLEKIESLTLPAIIVKNLGELSK
ncbi:MAG: HAD hydrolase, family IIA [Candidatus Moranbacteria bacterium GW2011_GWA2_39_41]|nr:MAG: HAD hydrolase, family IIA [Candidatus Moranbacteria bacterium GW2011_GWA2_39_41]